MQTAEDWQQMVADGKAEDEIRNNWQKRIAGGLKGVKRVFISFEMKGGGICFSEYVVPFEKDQMKKDVDQWTPICSKVIKEEKPY